MVCKRTARRYIYPCDISDRHFAAGIAFFLHFDGTFFQHPIYYVYKLPLRENLLFFFIGICALQRTQSQVFFRKQFHVTYEYVATSDTFYCRDGTTQLVNLDNSIFSSVCSLPFWIIIPTFDLEVNIELNVRHQVIWTRFLFQVVSQLIFFFRGPPVLAPTTTTSINGIWI